MTLAIFDLDHTLLDGDSDYLWGQYMVENQIVDEHEYRRRNRVFYEDYQRGELDNDTYLEFALAPLTRYSIEELYTWRADYVENWIKPIIAPGARDLLERHRRQNHELLIISATHRFITGRYLGTPTYREGKVTVLREWLANTGHNFDGSYFYSDSINDLALLEQVDNPIAVHPDDELKAIASSRGWKIIDLK
jgi:phosphoserine phosphatase